MSVPVVSNGRVRRYSNVIARYELLGSKADHTHSEELRPRLRDALVTGFAQIALELTARFLADALNERYFGWDATRFATRGEHNLLRARGQWALHEAVMRARPTLDRAVRDAFAEAP